MNLALISHFTFCEILQFWNIMRIECFALEWSTGLFLTDRSDWLRSRSHRETCNAEISEHTGLEQCGMEWRAMKTNGRDKTGLDWICLDWTWECENELIPVIVPPSRSLSLSLWDRDKLQKVAAAGMQPKLSSPRIWPKSTSHGMWRKLLSDLWPKSLFKSLKCLHVSKLLWHKML